MDRTRGGPDDPYAPAGDPRRHRARTAAGVVADGLAAARLRATAGTGALPADLDPDPDPGPAVAVQHLTRGVPEAGYFPLVGRYCLAPAADGSPALAIWPWDHNHPDAFHILGD